MLEQRYAAMQYNFFGCMSGNSIPQMGYVVFYIILLIHAWLVFW